MSERAGAAVPQNVPGVMAWLEKHRSNRIRSEMGPRYGIHTEYAIGVRMADMIALARKIGRDHALAAQLWATGNYEARTVACMIDDPNRVTPAQMNRWCRDFDNWGICDTACFKLFDCAPKAWAMVRPWARKKPEFQRRAAFALLACLALHDRKATDQQFLDHLPLLAEAASDRRNFVRKGVEWARRAIARRSPALKAAVAALAVEKPSARRGK